MKKKKKREQNQTKCTGDRPHDFKPGSWALNAKFRTMKLL